MNRIPAQGDGREVLESKTGRAKGIWSSKELHNVFCALIVSRILYALPAWGDSAFALPYCHYNIYKHSFVLPCIFDGAYKHIYCFVSVVV